MVDQPDMQVVVAFCSSSYDPDALGAALWDAFGCPIVACTTAGEIGDQGYQRGGITAVSLAGGDLTVTPYLMRPLANCRERAAEVAWQVRARVDESRGKVRPFGLLLIDGLSFAEESLAAALYELLGDVTIVGGSAGDDLKFQRTGVYWNGHFVSDAAVFILFETSVPFTTIKCEHFRPTDKRLVTTAVSAAHRVVHEMDGVPAATAYARVVGVPIERLGPHVFSKHPVMLRIGWEYYVRSIRAVERDLSLSFFCAIDEGLVLTVGERYEPIEALTDALGRAKARLGEPSLIIGCDCILRRLDFEQQGMDERVGSLLAAHRVIGFSTYGEQLGGVHINHTFTGIALGSE